MNLCSKLLGVSLLAGSLVLTGCASSSKMTASQKHQLISEYNQQKTFEIECTTGCKVSYKDPRDQLNLPSETNGYDVVNTAIKATAGIITTAVPYAAIGVVAAEGIKSSGDNVSGSYNSSQSSRSETSSSSSFTNEYKDSFNTSSNVDRTDVSNSHNEVLTDE